MSERLRWALFSRTARGEWLRTAAITFCLILGLDIVLLYKGHSEQGARLLGVALIVAAVVQGVWLFRRRLRSWDESHA